MVSYLRLAFIIAGIIFCVENQIIAAIVDFTLFAALYFILEMSNKNRVIRITGHKYSFSKPMTIYLKR